MNIDRVGLDKLKGVVATSLLELPEYTVLSAIEFFATLKLAEISRENPLVLVPFLGMFSLAFVKGFLEDIKTVREKGQSVYSMTNKVDLALHVVSSKVEPLKKLTESPEIKVGLAAIAGLALGRVNNPGGAVSLYNRDPVMILANFGAQSIGVVYGIIKSKAYQNGIVEKVSKQLHTSFSTGREFFLSRSYTVPPLVDRKY